jgi:hypothetical protein
MRMAILMDTVMDITMAMVMVMEKTKKMLRLLSLKEFLKSGLAKQVRGIYTRYLYLAHIPPTL